MAPWMELPYEITNVTPEEDKIIRKCLLGYLKPFVRCGGYVMPGRFKKHAEAIYNMEVRPDDIWVITFPRSGTTWTQEMVWLLENELDYKMAKKIPLYERFPMLEISAYIPEIAIDLIKVDFMHLSSFQGLGEAVRTPTWELLKNQHSQRFIKTHLPLSLLPPKLLSTAKVIYVARDPRDVAVSYYYLHKMFSKGMLRATFPDFWEAFRRDLLPWTPIVEHANEAWTQRHNPNLHIIFYEDLKKDLPKEIKSMSKFLNKEYSAKQLQELADYLSFESLKNNKSVNNNVSKNSGDIQLLRKGEAGGWRTHFTYDMELQAEEFLCSKLQDLDITYPSISISETTHL